MIRTELKVIAVVIVAVLALEGVVRIFASVLDTDRTHIHAFPELIGDLHENPAPRVVFFGNSLMKWGLDLDIATPILSETSGKDCHAEKIVPVGTAIVDWIYLYQTYFTDTDQHPEAIVVGFVAHHVPDVEELKIRRLARHFCSPANIWTCLGEEADDFEMRALGFCSYHSAIFGDQQELQLRALAAVIPSYGYGTRTFNGILERAATRERIEESGGEEQPQTYGRLRRFIALLKDAGVSAYFVPMPQPEIWELDPEFVRTVEEGGMEIIDARAIESIKEDDFYDGYHLGTEEYGQMGARKFSEFIARELGLRLK